MKLNYWLFGAGFVLLTSANTVLVAGPGDDKAVDRLVQSIAMPYQETQNIPGIAIAVYFNGQDYFYNFGFANKQKHTAVTKDTIFELASLTKLFVSTLLAYEVQEGNMKLSDSVSRYIPALKNTQNRPIDSVTVTNLATHTSSFPRQMEQFGVGIGNVNGFINKLKSWHPAVLVGTQYKYSNIGFGFLGLVLEQATGDTLGALTAQIITKPLGMSHTFFSVPGSLKSSEAQGYRFNNNQAPYYVPANLPGGGALRSSSSDLLQFVKANLGIKVQNASPQLLAAMQLTQQPYFTVRPKFKMGLGWQRVQRGLDLLMTKNGANQGFNTFMGFSPEKKIGVVVLTNKAKVNATRLGNRILNRLLMMQRQ